MGDGYHVLIWDGFLDGLNMVNPRLLHDEQGNNWWPCPVDLTEDQVTDLAIRERKLPWLDGEFAPPGEHASEEWQGGAFGSTDYSRWQVLH